MVVNSLSKETTRDMIQQESNVVDFMEKPLKPGILGMQLHRLLKTSPPTTQLKPLGDW